MKWSKAPEEVLDINHSPIKSVSVDENNEK